MKDFTNPLPQKRLDIDDKSRSNLFAWRGQFSSQLIECLLDAYCLPDIIERIALESGTFEVVLRQKRVFMNRFGNGIQEDILNPVRKHCIVDETLPYRVGRGVAQEMLGAASASVPEKNGQLLSEAIDRVNEIDGTPIFNGASYSEYQTRDSVMMVKENKGAR
ncbi:hypothetical protein NKDENANG_03212 [Candidatus Entotheonellaceae bacterium PAL068K]